MSKSFGYKYPSLYFIWIFTDLRIRICTVNPINTGRESLQIEPIKCLEASINHIITVHSISMTLVYENYYHKSKVCGKENIYTYVV